MTRSSLMARRVALPVTAALVGGTFAAIGFSAPAQAAGSQPVDKSFTYQCQVFAGPLDLGLREVGVRTVTRIPATVFRGERIAPTPVAITLAMPDVLRDGTRLLGTEASGQSTNAAVTLSSAGRSMNVRIPSLSAARAPIPADSAWTIAAKGTVPAITTPAYTAGAATLSMPAKFYVTATIYGSGGNVPATMDCSTTQARTLASIRQVNAAPKAPRTVKVVTKKNKAKKFVIRATDADRNRLTFKAGKVSKKAGKVSVRGSKLTFKPRKNFKGKAAFYVSIRDGKGGSAKTKVVVTVKK
ncbi:MULTISPECIES: DUF6801 domain-containing protein [Aeromicrobium]|uniref:DUF6801 domain-containing protein n=1 Tax=Aeromicrobium TaxID=2040 RepID=UPI00257EA45D|nr:MULTISPECIES: DUF6801 domain-containing protein [Aeromicrobium]